MEGKKMALLEVKNLKKYFPIMKRGFRRKVVGYLRAVDGISFHIEEGETLGLVGESGCGKTTTAKLIMRGIEPTDGEIVLNMNGEKVDITKLSEKELREKGVRRFLQMIFQDPYSSLNPRMTVRDIVAEPLVVNGVVREKEEIDAIVSDLLRAVGLRPEYMQRYPHAFSGGQRQRIAIARAIALKPKLVLCDEPTSALDVSVQAQIINLLKDLQKEYNLTYLFISHDLGVVEHITSRVAVMYVGRIVELAETEELFSSPKHPYTEALLSAVPKPDPKRKRKKVQLTGEVPDPSNPPPGCYFHPRCPYAKAICKEVYPDLRNVGTDQNPHLVACHFADSLELVGVNV
jgi:peptide/nickel transport system ATP-binding protein